MTKYKVGDKVRVRSNLKHGDSFDGLYIANSMMEIAGKDVEITMNWDSKNGDRYEIDGSDCCWSNECFEPIEPAVGECVAIDGNWRITAKELDKITKQHEPTRSMKEPVALTVDGVKPKHADATEFNKVTKPSHYADKEIEVIDYIKDTLTKEEYVGYCMGNVIKYVSRWRKKGGIEDLNKAKVYLDWAIKGASADGK